MARITNLVLLILYAQPVVEHFTVCAAATSTTISESITTMESTESPSTMDGTSSIVTESETTAMTSITTLTSSMSSSPSQTTTMDTVSSTETTMTKNDTSPTTLSPTMATAGPVLGQAEIIAICVGGGVLLLVLIVIAAFCIYKKHRCDSTDTRPLSKIDEGDYTTRMSMHRPESSTMNADGDLAFLTFTGKHNEVDGIVNPTYDTTVIDEIPNNNQGGEEKVYETNATILSKARLTQNSDEGKDEGNADDERDVEGTDYASETGKEDVEGAVHASETGKVDVTSESPPRVKEGEVRPISGISYKSEDIDLALEVLDVGTV